MTLVKWHRMHMEGCVWMFSYIYKWIFHLLLKTPIYIISPLPTGLISTPPTLQVVFPNTFCFMSFSCSKQISCCIYLCFPFFSSSTLLPCQLSFRCVGRPHTNLSEAFSSPIFHPFCKNNHNQFTCFHWLKQITLCKNS